VAPGAGHIAEGLPLPGLAFLVIWLCAAVSLFAGGKLYPLVDPTLGLGSSLHVYLAIAVMLTVLLAANTMAQPRIKA
jgi:hypothetical protein